MILFKVDTKTMTVRQVEGERWPGKDSEGDVCYVNTHFKSFPEALSNLEKQAKAYVSLSASSVKNARESLAKAEKEAADAIIAADAAFKFIEENTNAPSQG